MSSQPHLNLLVTGAGGFLGRAVVDEALRRGHHVRAVVRPAADLKALSWRNHQAVELIRGDLRSSFWLPQALRGVDAVLHLAAAKTGDLHTQLAGTVLSTENLLEAMVASGVRRIVALSSFSVYDFRAIPPQTPLTEWSLLERQPELRDAYAQVKLLQERLVRQYAQRHGWGCTMLRPGAIYGKNNLLCARAGMWLGQGRVLQVGLRTRLPLTYVDNCALAVILCSECHQALGRTFNVVDDHPPTVHRYLRELRRRWDGPLRIYPLPWPLLAAAGTLCWVSNRLLLGGKARLPGLLIPARAHARFKPLRYSNRSLSQAVQWRPRYSLEEALDRVFDLCPLQEHDHLLPSAAEGGWL